MRIKQITFCAVLAAVYAALTIAFSGLSYGDVQFRFSEALTVLPFFGFMPVYGLTLGCLISNILSPYGVLDLIVGTAATLVASVLTFIISKSKMNLWFLAPLPPVVVNMIFVGGLLTFYTGVFTFEVFMINALKVGLGQLVCCYGLGIPLMFTLKKNSKILPQIGLNDRHN